jgi:hypothetical protein
MVFLFFEHYGVKAGKEGYKQAVQVYTRQAIEDGILVPAKHGGRTDHRH